MDLAAGEQLIIAGDRRPLGGMQFRVRDGDFTSMADGRRFFRARLVTSDNEEPAGVGIEILLTGWDRESTNAPGIFYYRGDVRLHSLGASTEHYVARLENAFGIPTGKRTTFEKLFCECVAICCDPLDMEESEFVARVFVGSGNPVDFDASFFVLLDVSQGYAAFTEKDAKYRHAIVKWLRGEHKPMSLQ